MCWGPWQAGIKGVIRLNGRAYDRRRFTNNGLAHYDLYFPDGRCLIIFPNIDNNIAVASHPTIHTLQIVSSFGIISYNFVDMCVSSLCKRTMCGYKVASNDMHSSRCHHSVLI